MPTKPRKTVFILGAGFSMPAGIPSQAKLLGAILSGNIDKELEKHRKQLKAFIKNVFGLSPSKAAQLDLEDIYTPIHQSIARNQSLKGYSPEALKKLETSLNILIGEQINIRVDDAKADYVVKFAEVLVKRKEASRNSDSFAVFSLNWDILLDRRLFSRIDSKEGTVDYCCHCAGVDKYNKVTPGLLARGQGLFTVKLLKLHGSLNWLNCSECGRLFINRLEKIARGGFDGKQNCRFCSKNHVIPAKLDAALLLPIFQKDMARFHFQHIWNQAGIELSEATKLVFIGYSFPLADFDFRSLITKHVGDVDVEVVLWSLDGSETEEGQRYRKYFGDKITEIHYDGVEEYVQYHLASSI
jgi:hypothetical protein